MTLFRGLRLTGILYVLLLSVLYLAQGWLILPGRLSQGSRQARFEPPPGTQLVPDTPPEVVWASTWS